jgi:hypothetical protein
MSEHDEMIRSMRQVAGLPVEDRSEEVRVIQPKRDTRFAMREARDLAGINDYQTEEDKQLAKQLAQLANQAASLLSRLPKGSKALAAATEAATKLRIASAAASQGR